MNEEELREYKLQLENDIKHYTSLAMNNRMVDYYFQRIREARKQLHEVNEILAKSYS